MSIVSGKPEAVKFNMGDDILETFDNLENDPHKFLGCTITFRNKQSEIFQVVQRHFTERLDRIDALLIRNEFKVKIYHKYVLPASRFILTVHNLTSTSLDRLDATSRRYLKKWLGLPNCATPALLHAPQVFDMNSIKQLYSECQANAYASSRSKADEEVQNALDSRLERESSWKRKNSIIVKSDNILKEVMNDDNQTNTQMLKTMVKNSIREEMKTHWDNHLKSLVIQGNFLGTNEHLSKDINFKSIVYNLPRNILSFFSNACIDTLPTNSNLKRWKKRSSPSCSLCQNKETLLHVLNNCKVMLDQGRYTWRHNSVLNSMYNYFISAKPDNLEIFCDLPDMLPGISTIPSDILTTNLRPDLVIINRQSKNILLLELTIPFDSNITSAHERKAERYENLVNDLNDLGYLTEYFPIEISSRGLITKENNLRLKDTVKQIKNVSRKDMNTFLDGLKKVAILSSYIIFYAKYEQSWLNPAMVSL